MQKINELKKNGQVGYIEPLTARLDIPIDGKLTPDVNLMGSDFTWVTNLTPTKEQFFDGKMTLTNSAGSVTAPIVIGGEVVGEATGAYCVRNGYRLFVVSTVTENELGTLPKTGMYVSSNFMSTTSELWGYPVIFDFGETTHTIDPKYLPSGDRFFDLNQYGLTVTEPVSLSPNEAKDLIEKILNGEIIGLRETTPIDNDGHQKQTLPFIRVCIQGSVDGTGTMLIAYVQKEVADTPPVSFTGLSIGHDKYGGEVSLVTAE